MPLHFKSSPDFTHTRILDTAYEAAKELKIGTTKVSAPPVPDKIGRSSARVGDIPRFQKNIYHGKN